MMKNEEISKAIAEKSTESLQALLDAVDAFNTSRELSHIEHSPISIIPNASKHRRSFVYLFENVLLLKSDLGIFTEENELHLPIGDIEGKKLNNLKRIVEIELQSRKSSRYPLISNQSLYLDNLGGPPDVLDFSSRDGDSDLFKFCKALFKHSQKNPGHLVSRAKLKRDLLDMGVDKDRLIEENFIDTTYGNLKKKISQKGLDSRINTHYSKKDKGYFFQVK